MTTASVCTIGDEILIGQIVDTNSSHISRALNSLGIQVTRMTSIGDDHNQIIEELSNELSHNSIVIVTGGLGPTRDDITKEALAELSGATGWVEHPGQKKKVEEILHSRGIEILEANIRQAFVPDTCEVIVNKKGTAPVMVFPFREDRFGHKAVLYSLPGVPYEALGAIPEILEDIKNRFSLTGISFKTIMTYGVPESALSKMIEPWETSLPDDIHLAYLPNLLTGVRLRLSIFGGDPDVQKERLEAETARLTAYAGQYIYAFEDTNMESVIGSLLRGSGRTLSCAESCTGGMISHLITSVPGSSEYYLGSVTSYAAAIKSRVLGVDPQIIEEEGIVSSAVAEAMARGVRKLTGSTYAISTTGWADSYGDEREPAGTVWVGVTGPHGTQSFRFNFRHDRKRNIERFASSALNLLREYILKDKSL